MATGKDAMSRATHKLAQLWQLPLLLLSWLVFALAAYLFINSSPGLTVKKRIEMAQLYIQHERPEAALVQLNHLLTSERLTQESEGAVHLHIADALAAAQRQRDINIPANHQRILEQTQLALGAGVHATGDAQRRLGYSCLALGQLSEAIAHYR